MRFATMTTRRWMVVVAAVAVITSAGMETRRLRRLSRAYRAKALAASFEERGARAAFTRYAKNAVAAEKAAALYRSGVVPPDDPIQTSLRVINERFAPQLGAAEANQRKKEFLELTASINEERARGDRRGESWARDRAGYFTNTRQKYERLARYPWLTAEPDPPPPK